MIVRKEPMPDCFGRRTSEWLRQEVIANGLRVGRKVRIEYRERLGNDGVRKFWRSGKVTGIYRYIFACKIGEITECFRYNELLGNETERVKLE